MKTDGKFIIESGGITQGIQKELGLSNEECKQLQKNSVWEQIINEVDNNTTVENNNNEKPNKENGYKVYKNAVISFTKDAWQRIVTLVNTALKKNIEIEEQENDNTNETLNDILNSLNSLPVINDTVQDSYGNITKKDLQGRIIYKKNKEGTETTFEYNDDNSYTQFVKFSDGETLTTKFNSNQKIIYEKDNYGRETFYEYNSDGSYLLTITDDNKTIGIIKRDNYDRDIYEKKEDGTEIYTTYDNNEDNPYEADYVKEIHKTNGMKIISKYNKNDKMEESTQYYKNYEVKFTKQGNQYLININDTTSRKTQVYTLDNVFAFSELQNKSFIDENANMEEPENINELKDILFDKLSTVPSNILSDLASENPRVYISDVQCTRSYMLYDEQGEYLVINLRDAGLEHEIGHILDHIYSDKTVDESFYSNSEEFINAFNIGLERYIADGHEPYSEDENTHIVKGADGDNYGTWNPKELFTGIYHYVTTGERDEGTSIEVIDKYFYECRDIVIRDLEKMQNGEFGDRSLNKFIPKSGIIS